MSDIIALEQDDADRYPIWSFYDLDNARRYIFARTAHEYGWLVCDVCWLPVVGDPLGFAPDEAVSMERMRLMEDEDARLLLQAFRRRCKLDPIPDRVFGE